MFFKSYSFIFLIVTGKNAQIFYVNFLQILVRNKQRNICRKKEKPDIFGLKVLYWQYMFKFY